MRRSLLQRPDFAAFRTLPRARKSLYHIQYRPTTARVYSQYKPLRSVRSSAQSHRLIVTPHRRFSRVEASYTPYLLFLFALVTSTAVFVEYVTTAGSQSAAKEDFVKEKEEEVLVKDDHLPDFAAMPIPPGTLGNLTPEQEQKLKEFWAITLRTFGVKDPADPHGTSSVRPITPAETAASTDSGSAKKKEKHGLFHRKNKESTSSSGSPGFGGSSDPEDKYGQTGELQEILATSAPDDLRQAFWSMTKKDHPDALLLRFLRARKWNVQNALAMLISTMHWRRNTVHVDDDIMKSGEGGALKDSQSNDPNMKKEGADFLAQLRLGKSFIHGADKEGRPICFVRVRLHKGGEQSERSLERYTVYVIETCRLALQPPVETATIVFDMTSFTMANMDYTPVKFMIKCFEANYPESLGSVIIHKAPWIFQGVYKIIKGWLDPVVAAKVHFTNDVHDLQDFIPKSHIIKELGGEENWEYKYVEPLPEENQQMNDEGSRRELEQMRQKEVQEYERQTFEWIHGSQIKADRDRLAQNLTSNYWKLDPLIRARSLYDRTGMLGKDGTMNFYPSQTVKKENLPGTNGAPPRQAAHADDVD